MEKTLEKTLSLINENEKVIANILHDVKSPLYSIKIALQNKLDNELNRDIFETAISTLKYIENFLVNYSFQSGKFENKISFCNVKEIINQKIEHYKYIFIDKNIHIDFLLGDGDFLINTNEILLSSIIGNIISNMAFHGSKNKNAQIEMYKKRSCLTLDFKNYYSEKTTSTSLGLDFCQRLIKALNAELKIKKTREIVHVFLKVPDIKLK